MKKTLGGMKIKHLPPIYSTQFPISYENELDTCTMLLETDLIFFTKCLNSTNVYVRKYTLYIHIPFCPYSVFLSIFVLKIT